MTNRTGLRVAIIDYGLGNLFSVFQACGYAGMEACITSAKKEILSADAAILPGVGAFGDAMRALERLELVLLLRDLVSEGKPLIGICLGMQLLMTESYEFGRNRGLGVIEGPVVRLEEGAGPTGRLKVPEVGWNRIFKNQGLAGNEKRNDDVWAGSPLEGLQDGEYMYFVHSYYPKPEDPRVVLSVSRYGNTEYCSGLMVGNVFAAQFHPERSGRAGLRVYENIAAMISKGERK